MRERELEPCNFSTGLLTTRKAISFLERGVEYIHRKDGFVPFDDLITWKGIYDEEHKSFLCTIVIYNLRYL